MKTNSARFNWMKECRWTIKEIRATFRVPSAIAAHIQSVFCSEEDAYAIAAAHNELTNQVGF